MNEYDVFLKLRADHQAAARAYRSRQFAREAAATSSPKSGWLRVLFNAVSQQIVKLVARRAAPVEIVMPDPTLR